MKALCFLLLFLPSQLAYAESKIELGRSHLRNYGISYCLNKFGDEKLQAEASLAVGGFFQLGSHDSAEAYRRVRAYFDSQMIEIRKYQVSGMPAVLMQCLNISGAWDYERLVREQDKYISR